ncbi:phosphoribosyltransferase [Nostoc sp. WHI]|uniref:phosphoribosyltransferase n=1 Tax=Nostoc sp. WHI TaxID=2650611 RepID=UPI0018C5D622|nr:phosphoribosyltransferase family protein [Nostoc sp. WHI]MBG1271443.1 phosphoribosyltransferase [Nostoc sp. WHI]
MLYTPLFADRTHAGEELARVIHDVLTQQTVDSKVKPVPIVYALPRGGVPVAAPIARLLGCPLTIIVAKKISHPENPELAIGAVTTSGNVLWTDQKLFRSKHDVQWREVALNKAINQAKSVEEQLISACPQVNAEGATLILVDDGIATGMTIAVAATAIKALSPAAVWLCTPVAPQKLLPWLNQWGDRTIVLETPEPFRSVSNFYAQFPQVDTSEVLVYLHQQKTMGGIDLCE